MKSATVSAKIPRDLREKLRKHGLKVTEIVRRALEEEVAKAEERELRAELDEVSRSFKGRISEKDVILAVRASREGR
jgi:post-segregation antitoxin (ccd killing protein)